VPGRAQPIVVVPEPPVFLWVGLPDELEPDDPPPELDGAEYTGVAVDGGAVSGAGDTDGPELTGVDGVAGDAG
jgi:hypothetical protein